MNRNQTSLISILLAAMLAVGSVFFAACQSIENAKEDYPIAYNILKGSAEVVLLSQVPQLTDDPIKQAALRSVIRAGFAVGASPGDVAIALADGVREVYPDDTMLQNMIAAEWAAALRAESDATAPASAPGARQYQLDLAEALAPMPAAPAGSAAVGARGDVSLVEWLTSSDARKANRAYYDVQEVTPEQIEQARKLNALMQATTDDGTVNDAVYRYHANQ